MCHCIRSAGKDMETYIQMFTILTGSDRLS